MLELEFLAEESGIDYDDLFDENNDLTKEDYQEGLISPLHLTNEAYHKLDGISASGLKDAWLDPKLYFLRSKLKRLKSPALEIGTALHEALLEPKNFFVSKYDLTQLNQDKLMIMIHNARLMFNYIVSKTINEHSLIVQDNGFKRKVRVDAYDKKQGIIYDVKTTRYNNPKQFIKDAYDFGYHLQAAFYIDTMRIGGYKVEAFAFLVVPSDSPNKPYAVQISDRFIEDGRASYTEVLENILNYKQNIGQVYFHEMDLPSWRLKQLGEDYE